MTGPRCWRYPFGCRRRARNSMRIGDHVYQYCDEPGHEPRRGHDEQGS